MPEPADLSLRARLAEALRTAASTQPCTCGSTTWSSCFHPGAPSHEERRVDAALAVVQAELDAKDAEVGRLEDGLSKLGATIHAFPDAHNAANIAHARARQAPRRDRTAAPDRRTGRWMGGSVVTEADGAADRMRTYLAAVPADRDEGWPRADVEQLLAERDALAATVAEVAQARANGSVTMHTVARQIVGKRQAMAERDACLAETNRAREAEQAALQRAAELENVITWDTTCGSCARLLESGLAETARAEKADALIQRVRDVTAPEPAGGWQETYYDGWGDALAAVGDALDVRDWEEQDACQVVEVDSGPVRIHGQGDLTPEGVEALGAVVAAAKRAMALEPPGPSDFTCPRCAAIPGRLCRRENGPGGRAPHQERRDLAAAAGPATKET